MDESEVLEDLERNAPRDAEGSEAVEDGAGSGDSGADIVRTVSDMTPDELRDLLDGALSDAAREVTDSISSISVADGESSFDGVVSLEAGQFGTLESYFGSQSYIGVFELGFLAILLGALVGVAITLHWRA